MKYLSVKNIKKFQHYSKRNPPWIKLYRSIFDNYDFGCLKDSSKLHLILIWLLASQCNNKIPNDANWLKQKLGVNGKVDIKPLIEKGFLVPYYEEPSESDSDVQADCKQMCGTEKRRDREETETYTHSEINACFEEDWESYPRKAGDKSKALAHYKKTVGKDLKKNRPVFQGKMRDYVQSVENQGYLKHGETFFKNWESLEVDKVHKNGAAVITPMQQAGDGRGEFVDMIIDGFQKIASDNPEWTTDAVIHALLRDVEEKDRSAAIKVLKDFQLIEAEVYEPDENNASRV